MSSEVQLQTLGFGTGVVLAYPSGAQTGSNVTPCEIGTVQNAKVDFSADIKELHGLWQFPVDTAVGKRSIKGTVAFAQWEGTTWNNLMWGSGGSAAAGSTGDISYREMSSIPATTPFTITVTNAATFVQDLGVIYTSGANSGKPLQAITSGTPTTGQYTVSSGVYTFAAADDGLGVAISYSYSKTTDGQTFTITNQAMGSGPIVGLYLSLPYEAPSFGQLNRTLFLPQVRFANFSLGTKLDDYTEDNTTFQAFANPVTGVVAQSYLPW
jgi:hypothetical protein